MIETERFIVAFGHKMYIQELEQFLKGRRFSGQIH